MQNISDILLSSNSTLDQSCLVGVLKFFILYYVYESITGCLFDLEHNCLKKTETFKNACNGCANPDQLQNVLKSTDWSTSYRL